MMTKTQAQGRRLVQLVMIGLLMLSAQTAPAQQAVPPLTGRVVDQAGILSPNTERTLTTMLAEHEAQTSNQIAVLTIPSLQGETIETYSIRVAETWALGTAANDNGVLLLVAVADRELRIEVGLGLEGALTDAVAGRIIRNDIVPLFRENDYESGVLVGVQSIIGVIEGTYSPSEASGDEIPVWFGLIFLIVPSMFALIGMFSEGSVRWFMFVFLIPFFSVSGFLLTESLKGMLIILGIYAVIYVGSQFIPRVREIQKNVKWSSSGSGGGWSSSSGGWSSGGGFSGGGGSFGGGGSSGSW